MPHWLAAFLAVATPLAAWRWVVRPLRRFGRDALTLLRQIRVSAAGVGGLTQEVRALAGSIVTLAAAMLDDQQSLRREHASLRENQIDLTNLVIELDASVLRLSRTVERHHPTDTSEIGEGT